MNKLKRFFMGLGLLFIMLFLFALPGAVFPVIIEKYPDIYTDIGILTLWIVPFILIYKWKLPKYWYLPTLIFGVFILPFLFINKPDKH